MERQKSGPKPKPAVERFWERVQKKPSGCWIYNNVMDDYGQISVAKGKVVLAHRFSYELHCGEIPKGMFVCHKCDVPGCVNPEHLFIGTHEENNQDRVAKGRTSNGSGYVVKVKPLRSVYKHQRALSRENQEKLKAEYGTGKWTQSQLAIRYRITQSTVSQILRGYPAQKSNPTGGKKRSGFFRRKMDPKLYQEIRDAYATGTVTQTELAKRFNCTQTHISRIVHKVDPQE